METNAKSQRPELVTKGNDDLIAELEAKAAPGVNEAIKVMEMAEKSYYPAVASSTAPPAQVVIRSHSCAL